MPLTKRTASLAVGISLVAGLVAGSTDAKSIARFGPSRISIPDFALDGAPIGGSQKPASTARPSHLQGGTIATLGQSVLVLDADSGHLIRTDADGKQAKKLKIAPEASQLVVDVARERAYVADRANDSIIVVDLEDHGLKKIDSFSTDADPFGLALSPDGTTLLVTSVADKNVTAFDVGTATKQWSVAVGPEPRGVAISADGGEALVTFLTTGVVGRIDLLGRGGHPTIGYHSLDPALKSTSTSHRGVQLTGAPSSDNKGKTFARNAFTASYVGNGMAVIPHQVSTPHLASENFQEVESSGYGGGSGFTPPITHRLAFLGLPDRGDSGHVRMGFAATNLHQPRAMAYNAQTDTLFIAGYGSDTMMALSKVSQASVSPAFTASLANAGKACGPNGVAVDDDTGQVVVFCELSRSFVRVNPDDGTAISRSPELAKSRLSEAAVRGKELFRRGNDARVSTGGAMACASCHAEARADSLSWFLQGNSLQTPVLAGRVIGSHPFKWDGKDHDLNASLSNTVLRLGGSGITTRQVKDLEAFLGSLPPPRTPTVEDSKAVARGKNLFESEKTACAKCHYGPLLTDQKRHAMSADLKQVDTPSLIGLANSAPYYHDGSAATLEALMMGNGAIHGMGRISKLTDVEIDELIAYLETL